MTRPVFRKSTYSSDSANCVEVATGSDVVLVRDSKDLDGPVLGFDRGVWAEFVETLKGRN